MDDILIRGGQVIDGTGAPARVADVAIRGGRIVAIEADRADSAGRVIDAHGCVVAPGTRGATAPRLTSIGINGRLRTESGGRLHRNTQKVKGEAMIERRKLFVAGGASLIYST